ncbi:MAG: hypothetical protein PF689_14665 [Deltaproteobacteria bacterium]|nr:hypothetical protein [Deltaproteobacteria bacterium]
MQASDYLLKKKHIILPLLIFCTTFGIFSLVSYKRILHPSSNNHYAYMADSWLQGRLDLVHKPPHGNDWVRVDILQLQNGKTLKGTWFRSKGKGVFKTLDGTFHQIKSREIKKRTYLHYVSFPPLPAVLMLPLVAKWGINFNDVLFTVFFAALNAVFLWFLLIKLRKKKIIMRTDGELISLVTLFCFGTVYFFSAVRGEVWYTAHIIGITFLLLYLLALYSESWFWAGLALGAAFATRPAMSLSGFVFLWHIYKKYKDREWKDAILPCVRFAVPALIFILLVALHNWLRFKNPFEFGHSYLNIRWKYRIEKYGLFSLEYLSRNLSVALTLLPRFKLSQPFVQISPHGMALWLTTPLLFKVFWQKFRNEHFIPLAVSAATIFLFVLCYQNSGFVQFGYRFSLDFTPFVILLLALASEKYGKAFYFLLGYSVLVNLFGAITFGRYHQFYPPGSFIFFVS